MCAAGEIAFAREDCVAIELWNVAEPLYFGATALDRFRIDRARERNDSYGITGVQCGRLDRLKHVNIENKKSDEARQVRSSRVTGKSYKQENRALSPGCEKLAQEIRCFVLEHSRRDFDAMIEPRIIEDRKTRADCTCLRIVRAVDESRDARLNHGSGTHGAGLDGDVDCGAEQAII